MKQEHLQKLTEAPPSGLPPTGVDPRSQAKCQSGRCVIYCMQGLRIFAILWLLANVVYFLNNILSYMEMTLGHILINILLHGLLITFGLIMFIMANRFMGKARI